MCLFSKPQHSRKLCLDLLCTYYTHIMVIGSQFRDSSSMEQDHVQTVFDLCKHMYMEAFQQYFHEERNPKRRFCNMIIMSWFDVSYYSNSSSDMVIEIKT